MKLGSVRAGNIYVTIGSTVGHWSPNSGFNRLGKLPRLTLRRDGFAADVLVNPITRRLLRPVSGRYPTSHVWGLGEGCLLATRGRVLFRSIDGGRNWRQVRLLPPSSGLMGLLPTSLCEFDGKLFIAEYAFKEPTARVLVSDDRGRTWSPFYESSDYRHFHGLFHDPVSGLLWGTTGDADSESSIGRFIDGEFVEIGRGSQVWRTVDLVFTPSSIIWGMDCSYCHDVRVLRLQRDQFRQQRPTPEPLTSVDNSVYYLKSLEVGDRRWLAVATQAEVGLDSTAPPGASNTCERTASVLVTSSESGYQRWYDLARYRRTRTIGDWIDGIPNASGYIFLEADPAIGFITNPFNLGAEHGKIEIVPQQRLSGILEERPTPRVRRGSP